MPRLPNPGSDDGTWGNILNDYLSVEHNADGTIKTVPIAKGGTGATDAATARTNLGVPSDSTTVHTAGDETIAGVKTFSASPVVPDSSFAQSKVANLTADLASKATDAGVVHLAGVETITGAKTYNAGSFLDKGNSVFNVRAYGAIADGTTHPLSERFASLADAQAVYPHATALTNSIDWAAIQGAANDAKATGGDGESGSVVLIPRGRYIINQQIVVPDRVMCEGVGFGTAIIANSSFPISTPLIRLGDGTAIVFTCGLRNLIINCNRVAGSSGVYSDSINESSGLFGVKITQYMSKGVQIQGGTAKADNFILRDVTLIPSSTTTASIGIAVDSCLSKNTIENITVDTDTNPVQDAGILITGTAADNGYAMLRNIHVEECADAVRFGANGKGTAENVEGRNCTNTVTISSVTSTDPVRLFNLYKTGTTPNVLNLTLTGSVFTFPQMSFVQGQGPFIVNSQIKAGLGLLSAPSFGFHGDTDTGVYRVTENDLGIVIGGVIGAEFNAPADGETALLIRRNVGGTLTLQRISMGAADSGGAGFKVLRVPN